MRLDLPLLFGPNTSVMGLRGISCCLAPNALKLLTPKDWSVWWCLVGPAMRFSIAINCDDGDDNTRRRLTCKFFDHMEHDYKVMSSFSEQKGLSLDRLQTLCLMAEKGGVMAAAAGNPNRQSLYSRQLRELEAFFGAPLVDRSRTPHSLNDLGRRVEKTVRGFLSDLEGLSKAGQSTQLPMVIGAGESVIQALLIPACLDQGAADGFKLVFRNLQGAAILSGLRSRRLDIGIAHDCGGHADLKSKRLLRYGVKLITSDAKLGKLAALGWEDLQGVSLALPEGDSELRRTVNTSLESIRSHPPVVAECTSHAQVVEAAMCRGVVGIVPDFVALGAAQRGLHVHSIKQLGAYSRELRILWHPASVEMKPQIESWVRRLLAAMKLLGG